MPKVYFCQYIRVDIICASCYNTRVELCFSAFCRDFDSLHALTGGMNNGGRGGEKPKDFK